MRVRRSIPQKPLTEDQKQRALEAQKNVARLNGWPLTANQVYQNYPSQAPSMMTRFQTNMKQNPFMRNRMTFEEKYGVNRNSAPVEETTIENIQIEPDPEDLIVPPSLEENADQWSPLPPGVTNASEIDDLDEYIKMNEEAATSEEVQKDIYENMDLKALKWIYTDLWGTRDISHNNNKKSIINLILELNNGTQKEEEQWSASEGGQDGSVA